ncbi:DUF1127 domain-containing protein [Paradevosia shaoguanensis]|uniref:DUF1127 domain-containing protein n=1 Tax=Paradevosia shaoguanensis TaxID=1335043 RepID=A0AA41UEK2_9HYPH|nr:DUF1127 domain-containing protein [Paradevosia shaoguanensis]MCF1744036.1 DUF1127 domain-containing protein [Paradevosia shaoguanensis]MCI0128519.1 DUF1127 domain-containing protein [Paradevosia shaoguanensis]
MPANRPLTQRLRDWFVYRRALANLCNVDDRLLADLGMERASLRARLKDSFDR